MQSLLLELPYLEHLDRDAFFRGLSTLEHASHDAFAPLHESPKIVSCMSAVRYLVYKSMNIHFPESVSTLAGFHQFPKYMVQSLGARQIIDPTCFRVGQIVLYYGKWFLDEVERINHIGIIINKQGDFYHSTQSGGGYTISNFYSKVKEGKIVTVERFGKVLMGQV